MSPIPSDQYPWLTHTLLKRILCTSDGFVNARIIDFELHDAVAKGENYGSQMMRLLVNYCVSDESGAHQKSFIVKTTLRSEMQALIDLMPIFAKEVAFYRDLLPKLTEYAPFVDDTFTFAPKCYAVCEDPLYFVLEDLKPNGYRNMDRRTGLDFHATEMVLKKVARFHAMGAMVYAENSPALFDVHKIKVVNPEDTQIVGMFMSGLKDCQELSRNWPGYEHFSSKLEKLNNVFIDKAQTVFETTESDFNVVTHGDLWVNNIMFKFDVDNNPIDVIVVDYQIGCIGSPAIDLTYLFYTSTTNDIQEMEWDRLLQIYHAELVKTLNAIGYPKRIPTLTELQLQMLKRSLYAVMISLTIVGPRHMEKTEHADLDLFFDNEKAKSLRQELYGLPQVRERILYLLDYFERKGFLEID